MLNDALANALSRILNSESMGKKSCVVSPSSKVVGSVLQVMHENSYLGSSVRIDSVRNAVEVQLIGKINKCGAIKPRFPIKLGEMELFENRFLPAKGFGILILSTTKGIITHEKAKGLNVGGRLLAYCY